MGNAWTRRQLARQSPAHTPVYDFAGQFKEAKVVSVYDGDTCKAIVNINGKYQIITVRCYGYNSPEISQSPTVSCTLAAKEAKEALEGLVLNRFVRLHFRGFDKYGRFLANISTKTIAPIGWGRSIRQIWTPRLDVNAAMIEMGRGTPYFGGIDPDAYSKIGAKAQCDTEGGSDNGIDELYVSSEVPH